MSKGANLAVGLAVGLVVGGAVGFLLGLGATKAGKAFLNELASEEAPADVANPQEISRPHFALKFPGNWKVDADDEDYDPDQLFSIDSPGSSFVMLAITDVPMDPAEQVQAQVESFVPKVIRDPARTPFSRWGNYAGKGLLLKGKMILGLPGGLRVFSHSSESRSFVVVESYYDEDLEDVGPGFKLIESTFELRD